jgi:hypothetical protein
MSQGKSKYGVGLWKTFGLVALGLMANVGHAGGGERLKPLRTRRCTKENPGMGTLRVLCGF